MSQYIYQIFYDEQSYRSLDSGFIPLNNSNSPNPDWFEFWPIYNYFRTTQLDENSWYGFFSPKFTQKTGFDSNYVKAVSAHFAQNAEVILFTSTWDFIAYFKNVFEQGEVWHEGITAVSQQFFNEIGYGVSLENLVNHSRNAVTSNYIVAKPRYWRRWLYFADELYKLANSQTIFGELLTGNTTYGERRVPWKVFIQERIHSVLLAKEQFATVVPDQSLTGAIFEPLFHNHIETRKLLLCCDMLKQKYGDSNNEKYWDAYLQLRQFVKLKPTRFR